MGQSYDNALEAEKKLHKQMKDEPFLAGTTSDKNKEAMAKKKELRTRNLYFEELMNCDIDFHNFFIDREYYRLENKGAYTKHSLLADSNHFFYSFLPGVVKEPYDSYEVGGILDSGRNKLIIPWMHSGDILLSQEIDSIRRFHDTNNAKRTEIQEDTSILFKNLNEVNRMKMVQGRKPERKEVKIIKTNEVDESTRLKSEIVSVLNAMAVFRSIHDEFLAKSNDGNAIVASFPGVLLKFLSEVDVEETKLFALGVLGCRLPYKRERTRKLGDIFEAVIPDSVYPIVHVNEKNQPKGTYTGQNWPTKEHYWMGKADPNYEIVGDSLLRQVFKLACKRYKDIDQKDQEKKRKIKQQKTDRTHAGLSSVQEDKTKFMNLAKKLIDETITPQELNLLWEQYDIFRNKLTSFQLFDGEIIQTLGKIRQKHAEKNITGMPTREQFMKVYSAK